MAWPNTHDDRCWFERGEGQVVLRLGTWCLSFTRIGNHLFQISLTDRNPIRRKEARDAS